MLTGYSSSRTTSLSVVSTMFSCCIIVRTVNYLGLKAQLKIQHIRLNVSILYHLQSLRRAATPLLPHIYHLADYYTWLRCFSFSQFIEEQFEVAHHSHRSLPTLLYPRRFGHLKQTQNEVSDRIHGQATKVLAGA